MGEKSEVIRFDIRGYAPLHPHITNCCHGYFNSMHAECESYIMQLKLQSYSFGNMHFFGTGNYVKNKYI